MEYGSDNHSKIIMILSLITRECEDSNIARFQTILVIIMKYSSVIMRGTTTTTIKALA